MDIPSNNTDKTVWTSEDSYQSIIVSEHGSVGMNHYGKVVVKSFEDWMGLAFNFLIEISDVVVKLNVDLHKNTNTPQTYFVLQTDGLHHCILFGDVCLWDSNNEEREWIEERKDYEDLENFVRNQYNKYKNSLPSI